MGGIYEYNIYPDEKQFQISKRVSFFWIALWSIVQVGIVLSTIYIPMWSIYFPPMQAGHVLAFLLAIVAKIVKNKSKWILFFFTKFFITLVGLISFYSAMGFLFTENNLLLATFFPTFGMWLVGILACIL